MSELAPANHKPGTPIVIFFKVREVVKKTTFAGHTLADVQDAFLEKFEAFRKNKESLPSFYIVDPYSKITHQLDDITDLYQNCVLEIKVAKLDIFDKSEIGFGYFSAFQANKLVFVMVGLPARGKTFVARKILRYLKWMGVPTNLFNVGNYRRQRLGAEQSFKFFDPNNPDGYRQRLHMAIAALDDMLHWLEVKNGHVAIYDATNSTKERRAMIAKRCAQENVKTVFLEMICTDPEVIERNVRETKLSSPDYVNSTPEQAVEDFRNRIAQYEKSYQPLDDADSNFSYVKVIDVGKQIIINNIDSYLPSRVIHFLMNMHITPRTIWLTRHGQSEDSAAGRIGGDSDLTVKGDEYAQALGDWVQTNFHDVDNLTVWTSTLKRSIATSQYINFHKVNLRALDEIDAGTCSGMTYDEIAESMPEEYAARASNKLKYRYPHGESYVDVLQRLEPVLFELERTKAPILVIGHQAVLRCLYAYFVGTEVEEIPFVPIQLHTLYELKPKAYGCDVKTYSLLEQ